MKSMLLSSLRKYSISFSKRCCSPHTWVGGMAVGEAPVTHVLSHVPAATLVPLQAILKLNQNQASSLFCSKPPLTLHPPQASPSLTPLWAHWHPGHSHLRASVPTVPAAWCALPRGGHHSKSLTSLTALLESPLLGEASLTALQLGPHLPKASLIFSR